MDILYNKLVMVKPFLTYEPPSFSKIGLCANPFTPNPLSFLLIYHRVILLSRKTSPFRNYFRPYIPPKRLFVKPGFAFHKFFPFYPLIFTHFTIGPTGSQVSYAPLRSHNPPKRFFVKPQSSTYKIICQTSDIRSE